MSVANVISVNFAKVTEGFGLRWTFVNSGYAEIHLPLDEQERKPYMLSHDRIEKSATQPIEVRLEL
ncbi:MAG: hypothetical protein DI626_07560 [Micavibrio aeruginosavorus]|uniref:Uncharacterized protein n=1 Tax=Micavibrio aeruginosavorus TaxID=349221 RepID=A0A2W5BUT1_9BACT|nr:MAG: hypothetical protein DI626_07560 [Micavibrio aeruginosavorus]